MLQDYKNIVTAQKLAEDLGTDDVKSLIRSAKKHDCLFKDGPFCYIQRDRYLAAVEAAAIAKLVSNGESGSNSTN